MKKPREVIRILITVQYPIGVNIPAGLSEKRQDKAIEKNLKKRKERGEIREVIKWERMEE